MLVWVLNPESLGLSIIARQLQIASRKYVANYHFADLEFNLILFRCTNEYSWRKKEKKEQMDTVRTTVKVLDRESVNKHDVVTTADIAADSLLLLDMVCQLFCKHYQINLPLPSYDSVGIF